MRDGTVIGDRYRIGTVIEETELGVLARARHLALDDTVLVKVLSERVHDARVSAKFIREARNSARVKSDHVARFIDVGTLTDGRPFLVMEDLQGEPLDVVIRKELLPEAEAVTIVIEACEALAAAHAVGIVHRELRASSIFLATTQAGVRTVKVMGFGSPRVIDSRGREEDVGLTVAGLPTGVPDYASPETFISRNIDSRTDVWSLGVVLYELLTGVRPFGGTNEEVARKILVEPPPPMLAMRPDMTPALEPIVHACIAKRPEERFPDMASLAQALAPHATEVGALTAKRISPAVATSPESSSRINAVPGTPYLVPPSLPSFAPEGETQVHPSLHVRLPGGAVKGLTYEEMLSVPPPAFAPPETQPAPAARVSVPYVVVALGIVVAVFVGIGVASALQRANVLPSQPPPAASVAPMATSTTIGAAPASAMSDPPANVQTSTGAPPVQPAESATAVRDGIPSSAPVRSPRPAPRPARTVSPPVTGRSPSNSTDPWGWNR